MSDRPRVFIEIGHCGTEMKIVSQLRLFSCCQCDREQNDDGSAIRWRCSVCGRLVCRQCTLVNLAEKTYYDETFCSKDCWDKAGRPIE